MSLNSETLWYYTGLLLATILAIILYNVPLTFLFQVILCIIAMTMLKYIIPV